MDSIFKKKYIIVKMYRYSEISCCTLKLVDPLHAGNNLLAADCIRLITNLSWFTGCVFVLIVVKVNSHSLAFPCVVYKLHQIC